MGSIRLPPTLLERVAKSHSCGPLLQTNACAARKLNAGTQPLGTPLRETEGLRTGHDQMIRHPYSGNGELHEENRHRFLGKVARLNRGRSPCASACDPATRY